MSLSGQIETVSFHGVLQLLCKENKTGILRMRNENSEEYQFFLLEGHILYAIQAFKEARLGRLLINDGIISEEILEQCIEKAKKQKEALGKVLVDDDYINAQQLKHYIYNQILEILITISHWDKGKFSYKDQNVNLNWLVVLKINTIQILMDALQQIDEHKPRLSQVLTLHDNKSESIP
jgi:hypothetical protein